MTARLLALAAALLVAGSASAQTCPTGAAIRTDVITPTYHSGFVGAAPLTSGVPIAGSKAPELYSFGRTVTSGQNTLFGTAAQFPIAALAGRGIRKVEVLLRLASVNGVTDLLLGSYPGTLPQTATAAQMLQSWRSSATWFRHTVAATTLTYPLLTGEGGRSALAAAVTARAAQFPIWLRPSGQASAPSRYATVRTLQLSVQSCAL